MNPHILIVDDEAEIRDLLALFLTKAGYRVTALATPAEAIALAKKDPPALLISYLQLEESDGLAMIDELRALLPQMPVLLLTGVLFDAQVFRETLSKKVSSYLPKTTPLARIHAEIQRLLA